MYKTIINPITYNKISIYEREGYQVLQKYVNFLDMTGGSNLEAVCPYPVGKLPILDVNEMILNDETYIFGEDEDLFIFFHNHKHTHIVPYVKKKLFNTIYCYFHTVNEIPKNEAAARAIKTFKNILSGKNNLVDLGVTDYDEVDEMNNDIYEDALSSSISGNLSENFLIFANVWNHDEVNMFINSIISRLLNIGIKEMYQTAMAYEILDYIINTNGWDDRNFTKLLINYLHPSKGKGAKYGIPDKIKTGFDTMTDLKHDKNPQRVDPFIELLLQVPQWSISVEDDYEALQKITFWESAFNTISNLTIKNFFITELEKKQM